MKTSTKYHFTKLIFLPSFILILFILFFSKKVNAQTFEYPEYKVKIEVLDDSSMIVEETMTNIINGTFHGLRRDIPLANNNCSIDMGKTCGGFESIIPLGIYDENGDKPSDGTTRFYFVTDTYSYVESARFEWEIYPQGSDVTNQERTWTIKYKVLGGIAWGGADNTPIFYWNTLPENRAGTITKAEVEIILPEDISVDINKYTSYSSYEYEWDFDDKTNAITFSLKNLSPYDADPNFTISYEFGSKDLTKPDFDELKPGIVDYTIKKPVFADVSFNGILLENDVSDGKLTFLPSGDYTIEFSHFGYKTSSEDIKVKAEETTYLEVTLKPKSWMQTLLTLNTILGAIGIVGIPVAIYYVIKKYKKVGKDEKDIKTIVPLFKPPEGVMPYLLGSIKDEKVDHEDVTGSIIDLAYRGYIKIKEIKKGSNYELTKLEGKKGDKGQNAREQELMTALFGSKDTMQTKDLTYSFATSLRKLEDNIYNDLATDGYFTKSPKKIRSTYLGLGILFIVLGIASTIGLTVIIITVLGVFSIFSLGLMLMALGFGYAFASPYMPAKTIKGSEVYGQILGFRMFMYTAERYRVQNLEPEDFEKYLSYAIVFKIEKQWAEKFKDIYKQIPDWYEGSGNVTDAIFISSFARNFSNATTHQISTVTRSSGGGGKGWSGSFSSGGSFGGFSGGGGGGGSVGGW